jgi:hypothetical protein
MQLNVSEDWLDVLERTEYEPGPSTGNTYQSYRFADLDISTVTVENYNDVLVPSLAQQVEVFIPPLGSFETADLQRYLELVCNYETSTMDLMLGLSLADPEIGLAEKRRYRCVAEYLIRQGELTKLRDQNGKLIKKIGNMQKAVVLYKPLPKLLETLKRSGLGHLIKKQPEAETAKEAILK